MDFPVLYAIAVVLSTSLVIFLLLRRHPAVPFSNLGGPKDMRLPPAESFCAVCFEGPEDGKSTFRCSTCKNQFYCSGACQSKDWNTHKYNCSLLPPEGLTPGRGNVNGDLKLEVARVSEILKRWNDAFKSNDPNGGDTTISGTNLPESSLIAGLELPPALAYSRVPPLHKKHIYRTPLVLISRLYLMHLVATLPQHNLTLLAEKIGEISMPSHIPRVYGPKLISRPADLSPGEYGTLVSACMPFLALYPPVGLDDDARVRWLGLILARQKLWNA